MFVRAGNQKTEGLDLDPRSWFENPGLNASTKQMPTPGGRTAVNAKGLRKAYVRRKSVGWTRPGGTHVGQLVTVEGVIERTNRSPRGRVFLDFNSGPDAPSAFGLIVGPET
jgi:hypothetical protein